MYLESDLNDWHNTLVRELQIEKEIEDEKTIMRIFFYYIKGWLIHNPDVIVELVY